MCDHAQEDRRSVVCALKPSRFNMWARAPGGRLVVYNSFSGALLEFSGAAAMQMEAYLAGGHRLAAIEGGALQKEGIFVPCDTDELARGRRLYEYMLRRTDYLHLILMPTARCNFRCAYCYEQFHGEQMSAAVSESVVRFVRREAANLRSLSVMWFGGEPLVALDSVEQLSLALIGICEGAGIDYSGGITTNGFLLTSDAFERCLACGISRFQVTLDGPPETHDRFRVLAGGGGTFHTILENLRRMRDRAREFRVRIRVNFTPLVIPHIPRFLEWLGREFGGDPRFSIQFHPVGRWGGPRDAQIEVCGQSSADEHSVEFMRLALAVGFGLDPWREWMESAGAMCYAGAPRSFVIGPDGSVFKCTVAFGDSRNQVGRITREGDLAICQERQFLWTASPADVEPACLACEFFPACQGQHCPLARILGEEKACPPIKRRPEAHLPLLAAEARARQSTVKA